MCLVRAAIIAKRQVMSSVGLRVTMWSESQIESTPTASPTSAYSHSARGSGSPYFHWPKPIPILTLLIVTGSSVSIFPEPRVRRRRIASDGIPSPIASSNVPLRQYSALAVSGRGAALDARHNNNALFWDEVVDDTIVANPTAPTEGFPLETSNITGVGVILHLTERPRHALAVR